MSRICLYYRTEPEVDRWIPGDRLVRPAVRRMLRGARRPSGVDKVFENLCLGLKRLQVRYEVNLPFGQLDADDWVGVLGVGRRSLQGYDRTNPIVAGVALMTHPSEWPTLFEDYPVARYLQHSAWADAIYRPWFGDKCAIWPVGIDTDKWSPSPGARPTVDFLIYNKIMGGDDRRVVMLDKVRGTLADRGFSFRTIRYGYYKPDEYLDDLQSAKAMIFLSAHESQGIAYQEALSCNVPVLAWDQGWWLDSNRFAWGETEVPATSVPYWDSRCGLTFKDIDSFERQLADFVERLETGVFSPRDYILENLTLGRRSQEYVDLLSAANRK